MTLTENYTYNKDLDCINSTLTFAGSLEILQTLNGLVIKCTDSANTNTDNATIVIPSEYTIHCSYYDIFNTDKNDHVL